MKTETRRHITSVFSTERSLGLTPEVATGVIQGIAGLSDIEASPREGTDGAYKISGVCNDATAKFARDLLIGVELYLTTTKGTPFSELFNS